MVIAKSYYLLSFPFMRVSLEWTSALSYLQTPFLGQSEDVLTKYYGRVAFGAGGYQEFSI
ncbi:MAG: hypothetical protein IPF56_01130 [Chloroflexi bacterium]|nr:hypothetical protein [Chloroflexota bacterium]MBK6710763.1 hypothetical protein [Chloroflexota bacterium]MBK7176445.1 hypothetical protein [Chloroflexota bacterium]MBK7915427.1 hypothetical protein [Chloroflexota bacterium]MBK8933891.1 hypothetical protein [Chloroflexota bacterium]